MHCFPDSVVIYCPYDGSTYQFNSIVHWLCQEAGQGYISLDNLQEKLTTDIDNSDERQSLSKLLHDTVEQLVKLNLIEH